MSGATSVGSFGMQRAFFVYNLFHVRFSKRLLDPGRVDGVRVSPFALTYQSEMLFKLRYLYFDFFNFSILTYKYKALCF